MLNSPLTPKPGLAVRRSLPWAAPFCLALMSVAAGASFAPACTIPVFRYALERWELTPYEIMVFHEGPLPAGVAKVLDQLEGGTPKINGAVSRVDASKPMTPAVEKLWRRQKTKTLPWLVVRLALAEEAQPNAWAGPLTEAALRQVVDSKARQALVGHLSRGVSAVFVLLESGKNDDDQAVAKLLETELARIAPRVKLPEQSAEGPQLLTALPLKASFATLRVSRDDPAERGLVRMLLGSEADLDKVRGPIVFPVFGRGRALCSVFGEDLTGEQLESVVRFLCGECSCTVKELNPGVDLLLAADWPMLLREAAVAGAEVPENTGPMNDVPVPVASDKSSNRSHDAPTTSRAPARDQPPPVATTPAPANQAPASAEVSSGPIAETAAPGVRWRFWLLAIGGACLLVLATGVWAFASRR